MFQKIRKWFRLLKKDFKQDVKWYGVGKAIWRLNPFHYSWDHKIWWVRHRTINRYHVIKTGLEPNYYDIDTLMVHGLFSLLCRFVEDEHEGISGIDKRIEELKKGDELDKDIPEGQRYNYEKDIAELEQVKRLYKWWKEEYPKFDDNDPMNNLSHRDFKTKPIKFDADGDPELYELIDERSPELREAEHKIIDESHKYRTEKINETTNNMIELIKLRERLWT